MKTLVLLGLLVAALGAVSASAAESPVTLRGYAGIVPGMSASEVGTRVGHDLRLDTLPGSPCSTAGIRVGPVRGYALFIDGKLGSLWFRRGVQTDRGIRIGSTAAELSRAYPKIRSRPDHYIPGARNVFVRSAATPHWRLRFDVSPKGKVTNIAFGNETVFLVEGCL